MYLITATPNIFTFEACIMIVNFISLMYIHCSCRPHLMYVRFLMNRARPHTRINRNKEYFRQKLS